MPIISLLNSLVTLSIVQETILPIADDVTYVEVRVKRATTLTPTFWSSINMLLSVEAHVSYDNEKTWNYRASFGPDPGGILKRIDNSEVAETAWKGSVSPGIGRKIKVICKPQNGPIVTTLIINTDTKIIGTATVSDLI